MNRSEVRQLLETIGRLSQEYHYRLPTKVILPSRYLDLLFCGVNCMHTYNKFYYHSFYGDFELVESKTLIKPKIIFTKL